MWRLTSIGLLFLSSEGNCEPLLARKESAISLSSGVGSATFLEVETKSEESECPEPNEMAQKRYKTSWEAANNWQQIYYLKPDEMVKLFRKSGGGAVNGPVVESFSVRLLQGSEKVSRDDQDTFSKVDDKKLGRVLHRFVRIQNVPANCHGKEINGLWFRIERKQKSTWKFWGINRAYKQLTEWERYYSPYVKGTEDGNYVRVSWVPKFDWDFNGKCTALDYLGTSTGDLEKLHEAFVNVLKDENNGRLPIKLHNMLELIKKNGRAPTAGELKNPDLWTSEYEEELDKQKQKGNYRQT